jgi:hypothetical protein
VGGLAEAGEARAVDALVDARPLLGREHTGEGKKQQERGTTEARQRVSFFEAIAPYRTYDWLL